MNKLLILLLLSTNALAITADEAKVISRSHTPCAVKTRYSWCRASVSKQIIAAAKKGLLTTDLKLPPSCFTGNNLFRLVDDLGDEGFTTFFDYPLTETYTVSWE